MALADTSVKWFSSGMPSAPIVDNNWGCMTALLDNLLVTGFNVKTIFSMTFAPNSGVGGVVTCNIPAGHSYQVGQVVKIAGAVQPEYNGEWHVETTQSDKFTYRVEVAPQTLSASTATSLTARVAPLGFEIVYTRTNKRAYRSKNPESLGNMLVVDDGPKSAPYDNVAYAKWAAVGIAENMSDIDTTVGAQAPHDPNKPNFNWTSYDPYQMGWYKWYYARTAPYESSGDGGGGPRNWVLVGDSRMFYLFMTCQQNFQWYGRDVWCFGDITSFKPGDQYSTVLHASDAPGSFINGNYHSYPGYSEGWGGITHTLTYEGSLFLRNHTQVGNPCRWGVTSLNLANTQMRNGEDYLPYPNGPDYSLWLMPVYCRQEDRHMRGMMPGLRWLPQKTSHSDLSIVDNVVGQEGRKFLFVKSTVTNNTEGATSVLDITGPWR